MAIAIRDEGAKVNSNINVTPMVDVMLVLLIIFMVITPMLQKDVTVDLAKVNSPEQMTDADKEDSIVVAITRDGGIFLGRDKIEILLLWNFLVGFESRRAIEGTQALDEIVALDQQFRSLLFCCILDRRAGLKFQIGRRRSARDKRNR